MHWQRSRQQITLYVSSVLASRHICEVDVVYDSEMSTDERLWLCFVTPTASDVPLELKKQKRLLKEFRRDIPITAVGVVH